MPLLVIFVKAFSWDILGVKSAGADGRKLVEEDGATKTVEDAPESANGLEETTDDVNDPPFTSPELQERFRNILKKYFEDVKAHLVRDQKHIAAQKGRNSEAVGSAASFFPSS